MDNFIKIMSQIRIKLVKATEIYAKEQRRDLPPNAPLSSGVRYGILMATDKESSSLEREEDNVDNDGDDHLSTCHADESTGVSTKPEVEADDDDQNMRTEEPDVDSPDEITDEDNIYPENRSPRRRTTERRKVSSKASPGDQKILQCSFCNKTFRDMCDLKRHEAAVHLNKREYKCTECDKAFNLKSVLTKHMKTHTTETRLQCAVCNKVFIRRRDLARHETTHVNGRKYKCTECNEEFNTKSTLIIHLKTHDNVTKYECDKCGKDFFIQDDLAQHLMDHTTGQEGDVAQDESKNPSGRVKSEERKYVCETCGKAFRDSHDLKRHVAIHLNKREHQCPHCDKAFNIKTTLRLHMMNAHRTEGGPIRKCICETCGKAVRDKHDLKRHVEIHLNKKEYKCPQCDKSFNTKVYLRVHLRTHAGARKHICETCGKAFRDKYDLKRHVASHLNKREFQCPQCNKCFNARIYLNKHMRTHGGVVRKHVCDSCGKGFWTSGDLKSHMEIHLNKKEYQCPQCGKAFNTRIYFKKHIKTHSGTVRKHDHSTKELM